MRYLVWSGDGRLLAALGFGACAWHLKPRDRYIGWDDGQRRRGLPCIANNARFLILPWVHSPLPGPRYLTRGDPAAVGRLEPALWLPAGPVGKLRRKPALQRHLLQGGQLDLRGPNSRPRQTGKATPPSLCAKTNLALSLAPSLPENPLRLIPYSPSASRFAGSIRLSIPLYNT